MGSKTNSKIVYQQLLKSITIEESVDEIRAVAMLLMCHWGISQQELLAEKEFEFDQQKANDIVNRINRYEPIQYILEEAYFFGRYFKVNSSVLIPRPETELIIELVKAEILITPTILDIGTGSGCIAISLALEIPTAAIFALDMSEGALSMAKENALRLNAPVNFLMHDILNQLPAITNLDVIVSNPPYVMEREKSKMNKNVLNYEPHMALFVKNDNPLQFYEAIAEKSSQLLKPMGKVFVEINSQFGKEVAELFRNLGYKAEVMKDMEGKDRVVKATLV